MVTIIGAEIEELHLPLRSPLVTARGILTVRHGFLLRLVSSDGLRGIGEASPAYWIEDGDLERTARELRAVTALAGAHAEAARLRAAAPSPAAACAVDTALLDLEARARGLPACALLAPSAPTSAGRVRGTDALMLAVAALLSGDSPEALAADAAAAVADGFRTVKIKVGGRAVADDVRAVAAVRARIGAAVALRLDANRAWSLAHAREALVALAPLDVEFMEEPLRADETPQLAVLRAATNVPLAADESVTDTAGLDAVVASGAVSVLVVKPARLGGPRPTVALALRAVAAGLRVVVTDSIESAVGAGATLHVAAALPSPRLAVGLGGARLLAAPGSTTDTMLATPWLKPVGPGFAIGSADA